jgi:4-hydroxybenzoyl-CoA thioesterase
MFNNKREKRAEWGDCDPAGIVFNPRFFEWFDAASAALFEKALGITKKQMLETYNAAGIPLVKTEGRFMKPVHYGDDIVIESTVKFGRSSFQVEHRITHNGETCAEGSETRVWTVRDENGAIKSSPIPETIIKAFTT